jgi:quercetin dioxygenase-like cupin family protein
MWTIDASASLQGGNPMLERSSLAGWWLVGFMALLALTGERAAAGPRIERPIVLAPDHPQLEWGPCPPLFPKGCEIAVLHGDPAKPNADVFFRVPAGYVIPPHWHTSPERMVLVSGELQVTYAGHGPAVLKAGTYAYGPPKAPHEATCTAAGPCVLFIAFQDPVDAHAPEGDAE